MELFVVNRYDEEAKEDAEENKEDLILKRLQKKINKRKQARLKAKEEAKSTVSNEEKSAPVETAEDAQAETDPTTNKEDVDEENQDASADNPPAESNQLTDIGFTILGNNNFKKPTKVKRVLPYWLANPTIMSSDLKVKTNDVDSIALLSDALKGNLKSAGIKYFFPVQASLLPWLLEGLNLPEPLRQQDVCVSAPTGSGKTLAFVLPIIQALSSRVVRRIRALVVLPVHELAVQVSKVFRKMSSGTDLKVALLAAQIPFATEQAILVKKSITGEYLSNVDIVVCTAGRLVEHLHTTEGFSLRHLRYLVLDEADKIMESQQNDWLHHVDRHITSETKHNPVGTKLSLGALREFSERPQKLLFSATLSQDPEKLQRMGLFQPRLFTTVDNTNDNSSQRATQGKRGDFIGRYTTPAELEEFYYVSETFTKPLSMFLLIKRESWRQVLCFTNSSQAAHRLSLLLRHLAKDMKVAELSSALDFKTREKTLKEFTDGEINILISTDALARGIDIENVDVVLSYDSPKFIKNYIHRIGRTGRAGKPGKAVTLVENKQLSQFKQILKTGGKETIPEMKLTDDEINEQMEDYKKALEILKTSLEKETERDIADTKLGKQGQLKRKSDDKTKNNKKSKRRKTQNVN